MGIKIAFAALVALVIGGLAVFMTLDFSDAAHVHSDKHSHVENRAIPDGQTAPTIALRAVPDTMEGYNLHLDIDGFTFSPERTGEKTDAVEGHAHLYVNGTKIGRVYGNWVHLSENLLEPGKNLIRVTLNDNRHHSWAVGSSPIEAVIELSSQ